MSSTEDADWARRQEKITRASTALTTAGATTLAALMAGKTKTARRVLPPKVHAALSGSRAEDVRNGVALASMITGVASGRSWAKKLRQDVAEADAVNGVRSARARNLAQALGPPPRPGEVAKGISASTVVRTVRGPRLRRALYRRPPLPKPGVRI